MHLPKIATHKKAAKQPAVAFPAAVAPVHRGGCRAPDPPAARRTDVGHLDALPHLRERDCGARAGFVTSAVRHPDARSPTMPRRPNALALLAGLTLAGAAVAQTPSFTISWWGFNGEKLNAIIVEPFKAICGCEVVFETGNNADRLNKLVLRGGEGADIAYFTDSFSQLGIEQGVFQTLDRSRIPSLAGVRDLAQDPQGGYGVAYTIGRVGIVYDSAKVAPITSWNDLWREDLRGKVSLPGITTTAGPMIVMQAGKHAGVDPYEDPDAAFAAVEALKPNVVKNYNTGSEMINLFSTGEIAVSVAQDFALGRLQAAVPTIVWADLAEGDIATLNTINIPKGAANLDLAYKYLDFVLSPEIQSELAKQGVDAPVHTAVMLTPEEAAQWTYGDAMIGRLNRVDYTKMNAAKTDWIDRWNEAFGQ